MRGFLTALMMRSVSKAAKMVRILKRAVRQNIRLDAFEDAKAIAGPLVEAIRFRMLLGNIFER